MIYRKTMVLFGMMDFCPPALGREYGKALATIHNSTIPDLIFQVGSAGAFAQKGTVMNFKVRFCTP